MGSADRLAAFEGAFARFVEAMSRVPDERIDETMEKDTPQRLLAELDGYNRVCRKACEALQGNRAPAAFTESDPAAFPAEEIAAQVKRSRPELIAQAHASKDELTRYLGSLDPTEWTADRGVRHPEGGPATVRRELEGLSRRYLDAADEILLWLEAPERS